MVSGKAGEILGHLHPEEPIFVFRAQDILSVMVLSHYARLVEEYQQHGYQLESIIDAANDFRKWQRENPGLVKLPD